MHANCDENGKHCGNNLLINRLLTLTSYDEVMEMNEETYNCTEKGGFMQISMANIVER